MKRIDLISNVRHTLARGVSLGSWMQLGSADVAEMLGDSGYDWVAIDLEHGAIDLSLLPSIFRSLELGNTLPLVRLADDSPRACKQVLDAGAGGVICPDVRTEVQAESLLESCRWPPVGKRGVGFSRANMHGKYFDDYATEAQQPLVIVMIEHIEALDQLESILGLNGIDGIFVGPYDLSASMGITGKFDHPEFRDALAHILAQSKKAAVAAGIHIVDPEPAELKKRISEGYTFIAYSLDAVMFRLSAIAPRLH